MNTDQLSIPQQPQEMVSSAPVTPAPNTQSQDSSVFKGQITPQDKALLLEFLRNSLKVANGVYSASITESPSGVNVSIPHGLGMIPDVASVSAYALVGTLPGSAGSEITCGVTISATGPSSVTMDATNIYVTIYTGTGTASRTIPIFWSAAALI